MLTIIMAITTSWEWLLIPSKFKRLLMTPIIRVAIIVPSIEPLPPYSDAPPSTAIAITVNSYPIPIWGSIWPSLALWIKPAIEQHSPQILKAIIFEILLLIPDKKLARGFDPTT